jgi:hypothetical protein
MRLDFNHRYKESDIIHEGTDKLTSLGEFFKDYSWKKGDYEKAPPGMAEFPTVSFRIVTNAQTIIIDRNFNLSRGNYYNCRISNKPGYTNVITGFPGFKGWLIKKAIKDPKFYELKQRFSRYKDNEEYDISYIIDGKKYLFTGGIGSWDNSGSFYKKCINVETGEMVLLWANVGINFDTPAPRWRVVKEEHKQNF